MASHSLFERYVNSKDNQTVRGPIIRKRGFERYVNSKDNQTKGGFEMLKDKFERYVNSKDNQTRDCFSRKGASLRDM